MNQESRSETVGIRVTLSEKRALELVVQVHGYDGLSNMLREWSLKDALAEGDRLLARLRSEQASPKAHGPDAGPGAATAGEAA